MSQPVLSSGSATRPGTGRFPLVRTRPFVEESPWEVYRRVAVPHRPSVLLESGNPSSNLARWSFVAADPYLIFSGEPGHYTLETAHGKTRHRENPLAALFGLLGPNLIPRSDSLPPFIGGAVGYLSYDVVRHYETLPSLARRDLPLPDLEFLFFDLAVAIDHHTRLLHMFFTPAPERLLAESHAVLQREGNARLDELDSHLSAACPDPSGSPIVASMVEGTHSEREYIERVQQCQAFIGAGDIYQANLAQRFSVALNPAEDHALHAAGQNLYHRLRAVNPSPFAGLFVTGNLALVSSSPERLVQVTGNRVTARPIAGTRPRGRSTMEDHALMDNLRLDAKERAEHLMLVDLARNDLGRVCDYGSVHVEEFMTIEQYSHVAHLVSEVVGILRPACSTPDLIRSVFPGGTITGAPKIRCMEIIEELEPVRRGPYTGSLGYVSWTGDVDFNILIRTMVLTQQRAYLQVGAGIVADSDPRREYQETLYKAQALFEALQ
jgi:aminodeoxychorismate synthase component I